MSTTAQRTRRRQAREETRRQIIDAAVKLLRERPFRDISVDALMAETGHSRTVFYRHFDDIPDLIVAVLQEIGNELYEVSRHWASAVEGGQLEVRENLARIVDFFARQGRLLRAVSEASHQDEEIERLYRGFLQMFDELTERAIARAIEAGAIEGLDPHETARALNCLNERYMLDSLGREPIADPEKVLDALTTIWERVLYGHGSASDG